MYAGIDEAAAERSPREQGDSPRSWFNQAFQPGFAESC